MPEKEGAEEKKTTKEVVNKKQKQILNQEDYIPEEGYDVARDEGRVSPAKDKKDATTAPRKPMSAKERKKAMQQAQQRSEIVVNSVVDSLRKKYGKNSVMFTQKTSKAKSNEELDLTQVAESLGGYIIEAPTNPSPEDIARAGGKKIRTFTQRQREQILKDLDRGRRVKSARIRRGEEDLLDAILKPNEYDPAKRDADIRARQSRKSSMAGKPRSARKRYSNQPSLDQVQKDIDRKELAKNKKYRDAKVKQSFEKSKNIKPAGPSSLSQRQSRVIGRGAKNIPSSVVKNVKATPQRAVSASEKIGTSFKKLRSTAAATKIGTASKGLESVGKVGRNLTKGTLKYGKGVGARLLGKGGAFGARTLGKAGAKFGAKRIYGVGSAIAGAEAIGRFAKGDIVGGTLAGAEAITGLIPGLGTAVSTGLGALGLARDVKRTRQAVGLARKAGKFGRKSFKSGLVGKNSLTRKLTTGTGRVIKKNPTPTAIGAAGAGVVGTNLTDPKRRRRGFGLPNLPAPSLTGGSAGFRTAG